MKLFWLSLLMLIVAQVSAQQSETRPPYYACYKTDKPIVVDGDIYGPEWEHAPWSDLFQDIRGKSHPDPTFSTRFKMQWDDQNLYIAAELIEPHLWATLTERDATIYYDNDFEVFFDPKGDAQNYIEFEINALGTEWDLMMTKPYRKGGTFINGFNITGLQTKVKLYGTLNDPSDTDQKWCVEMCVPFKSMQNTPIKALDVWRMNFSRVEWPKYEVVDGKYQKKKGAESFGNEENWVWAPTGVVDIHMPELWGHVQFVEKEPAEPTFWTWTGNCANKDLNVYFKELKENGISGIIMNGSKADFERVIPVARKYGIKVHAWLWIMNNGAIAKEHPEWLDYNRLGQSMQNKKAYVDYYKFLNPAAKGVKEAIVNQVKEIAGIKGLSGISLDYCRYVDAILPTTLWKNYGVVQDQVYPEWDYGYHPEMLKAFEEKYGYDPRNQADVNGDKKWLQFRLDKVNEVVEALGEVARENKIEITASPFPTPEMSSRMVYQDWGKWKLDRAFPMIYNGFYNEDTDWVGECVRECVRTAHEGTQVYAGVFVNDYTGKDKPVISEVIDVALKNGAKGVCFFQYDELNETQKAELKKYVSRYKKR